MDDTPCWRSQRFLEACHDKSIVLRLPDVRVTDGRDEIESVVQTVRTFYQVDDGKTPSGLGSGELEDVLSKAGLKLVSGFMDTADLAYHTRRQRPVVCRLTLSTDRKRSWVIVCGLTHGHIFFHCPKSGRRSLTSEQFIQSWSVTCSDDPYPPFWGIACMFGSVRRPNEDN